MHQASSTPQHHANKTEHDAKPGLIHKIADKLGIHKSDKTNEQHKHDGTTHPHDNDPNRIHAHDPSLINEKDSKDNKPGLGHKIADKLGMHKDDKHDHHHTDKTTPVHKPTELHNYQTGVRDNDPNRVQPHHSNAEHHHSTTQHHTTANTTGVKDKVEDKLGMDKSHDHHHHTSTDATHGTHGHGQTHGTTTGSTTHGHQQSNIDIGGHHSAQHHSTGQHHTTANTAGVTDKVEDKLGMDKSHDHHSTDATHSQTHATHGQTHGTSTSTTHGNQQTNIDIGGYPVNPSAHHNTANTTNPHSNVGTHANTNANDAYTNTNTNTNLMGHEHLQSQRNISSPGVTDNVRNKLGMNESHDLGNKNDESGNLFGLATNPDRVGQNNNIDDFHTASRGFGAGQPPVPGQTQTRSSEDRTQELHLPKISPQGEAGSIFSSSMSNNNTNNANPTTIDHDRHGHATSTGYTTTGTSHDLPADSGRTYQN